MPFAPRSIARCLDAFRAIRPDDELRDQGARDGADNSWAFAALDASSDNPPVPSLYLVENPLSYSKKVMEDPKSLMGFANFQAIGTWNANGTGKWAHGEGWIALDVELTQEQAEDDDMLFDSPGGNVAVIIALWKVDEGYACAVWGGYQHQSLTKIMGFNPWNDATWEHCRVSHGE